MKVRRVLLALALVGATVGLTGLLLAQEAEKMMDPAMEAWLKYATPGEHHKHLESMIGSWNTKSKFWMTPEAPAQESAGVAEHSWVLGGRFVQVTYKGEAMGQPFSGMGFMGYDNYQQKHIDVWMDTMGTMMMTSRGTCDGPGKVIMMWSKFADPVSGGTKSVRSVYRFVDPDKYILEMYEDDANGREFKSLEIVHTRRS